MKQRDLVRKLEEPGFLLKGMGEIMTCTEEAMIWKRSPGTKK